MQHGPGAGHELIGGFLSVPCDHAHRAALASTCGSSEPPEEMRRVARRAVRQCECELPIRVAGEDIRRTKVVSPGRGELFEQPVGAVWPLRLDVVLEVIG